MTYAFISYAHNDARGYVERLGAHLRENEVPHWYDHEIVTGERWATVIVDQLTASSALIVVMTPQGQQSEWVSREIKLAKEQNKPILPLRFYGDPFPNLADIQHEDVRSGAMPTDAFTTRLQQLLIPCRTSLRMPTSRVWTVTDLADGLVSRVAACG